MSALIQYPKRRHGAKGRGIGPGSLNLFLELFQLCLGPLKLCQYLLTNGVAKNGTETVFG